MGCGKSSTGRELAELLGAGFTDLDELVVRREGRSIPEI
ncbi:MAG: shikimate kinase, partial [Bacteroidetes bacterium]|nr:shikimate kinase [Candidatus Cryptobacteroides avistercoris]